MAHIILTGCTGRAGSSILAHALASPAIARISVLSRRPVDLATKGPNASKAQVIIHKDFTSYPPETLAQLKGATGCIWALGISAVGMSEQDYEVITKTYAVRAAEAFRALHDSPSSGGAVAAPFTFVFMSGEGANTAGTGQLFARVKGRAELALLDLCTPSFSVYNIRPGGIDPHGEHLAQRARNWNDRIVGFMAPVLNVVWSGMMIGTDALSKACLELVLGDGKPLGAGKGVEMDGRLVRNVALRAMGGL